MAKKMTKQQVWDEFREEVMPYILEREGGRPDDPMRHEAWTIFVDDKIKQEVVSERAYDWDTPKGLYSQRTPLPKSANPSADSWERAMDIADARLNEGLGKQVILDGGDDTFVVLDADSEKARRKVFGEHQLVVAHAYHRPRGRLRIEMDETFAEWLDPSGVYLHKDIAKPWLGSGGRLAFNPEPETKKLKAKLLR